MSLAVHQGHLYAGTFETGVQEAGHALRYVGGTEWEDLGSRDNFGNGMVNFSDGSTTALLSNHDMRIPIFYALNWPLREFYNVKKINFLKIKKFTFEKLNPHLIGSVKLAYYVLKKGGSYPLIFNSANEVAVNFFLEKKIQFMDILKIVKKMLSNSKNYKIKKLKDIYNIDKNIRVLTNEYVNNNKWNF